MNLQANAADDKLIYFFFNFPQKIEFDISCKLSPSPQETISMKCQTIFHCEAHMHRLILIRFSAFVNTKKGAVAVFNK